MTGRSPGHRPADLGPALTLGQMLDRAAAEFPDREAVVFKSARASYARLKERADDFARGLLALGVGSGDHVVLWMPNSVEWNVANLGIAKIGAVTVTCNSRYKALEVDYVLRQSDARALVMVDRFAAAGIDYVAILREICPEVDRGHGRLESATLPLLRHVVVAGAAVPAAGVSFDSVEGAGRGGESRALERITIRPEDPVQMLYTSGTTGEPKGCLLSHGNMYYKCRVYTELHGWTAEDRYLVPVPYFHIFGSMGGIAANCLVGSTQIVMVPKVLDVSIVGVPDAIMGEVVMAFVIAKDGQALTAEEIVEFGRGRIADFKVPRYVEVVDRFPLTGSGKVQKFKQRAYAEDKYKLKPA